VGCFLVANSLALFAQIPGAPCVPSPRVAEVLEERNRTRERFETSSDIAFEGLQVLRAGLRLDPNDFFLRRAYLEHVRHMALAALHSEEVSKQDALLASSGGSGPVRRYMAAYARIGLGTAEAKRRLEELTREHPDFAWPYLALAELHSYPLFQDPVKRRTYALRFQQLCPDSPDSWQWILRSGPEASPENLKLAATLREQLSARTGPSALRLFPLLWQLEFRVTPAADHGEVRRRVAADLVRLRPASENDYVAARFLRAGAKQAGDEPLARELEAQMQRLLPTRLRVGKDRNEGQTLPPARRLPKIEEALRLDPQNFWLHYEKLGVVTGEKDLIAAGEAALAVARLQEEVWMTTPPDLIVGSVWASKGVTLDRLAAMADRGLAFLPKQDLMIRPSDLLPPEEVVPESKLMGFTFKLGPLQRAATMYRKAGDRAKARKALTDAEERLREFRKDWEIALSVPAGKGPSRNDLQVQQEYPMHRYGVSVEWAELALAEGRKADALLLWADAARATRHWRGGGGPIRDRVFASARPVWNELGGSAEGWQQWMDQTALVSTPAVGGSPAAVRVGGWLQAAANVVLPKDAAVAPVDLVTSRAMDPVEGLKGKVTLINVWATWCIPCRRELPWIQKLHDRLRKDPDLQASAQVLTFNTDASIGLVAPFLSANQYTFPVWLSQGLFDHMRPMGGIPVNWITGRDGAIRWESIGFDSQGGEQWVDAAVAKLREMLR